MAGTQISDMTDSLTDFPDGAYVPFVVTDSATGLDPTTNYVFNGGLYLAQYSTFALPSGSSLSGFIQNGAGAVATTVQAYLRENKTTSGYGTVQEALDTGALRVTASTNLNPNAFTLSTDYQTFVGNGNVALNKQGNGTFVTVSAQQAQLGDLILDGSGFTGDNLLVTGADVTLDNVSSIDAEGAALRSTGGGHLLAFGGLLTTRGTDPDDYDAVFTGDGSNNIYNSLIGCKSGQDIGGVYNNGADLNLTNTQFGKFTALQTNGVTGGKITGSRFTGDVNIVSSSMFFVNNSFSEDVTIGDGATALSQIFWGSTNYVSSGKTFTLTNGVIQSVFDLRGLYSGGVTVTIGATAAVNNDIDHPRIAYTAAFGGSGGSPAQGASTLDGYFSRSGRQVLVDCKLTLAAGFAFGSSFSYVTLPFKSAFLAIGMGRANIGGSLYLVAMTVGAGSNQAVIFTNASPSVPATSSVPGSWANADTIEFTLAYTLSP